MAATALVGNMIAPGGGPASGCKLNSFVRNTSTRSPLYTDVGLTTPTTNPYVGDADGRLEFYFDSAIEFSWRATTADGATVIWEADVIGGVVVVTYVDGVLIHSTWAAALANSLGSGWSDAFGAAYQVPRYSATIGDGVATSFTVTHNLNTRDVTAMVRQSGSPYAAVEADIEATTVNTVTVRFNSAPSASAFRVTVTA